jgi:hypothetical protein
VLSAEGACTYVACSCTIYVATWQAAQLYTFIISYLVNSDDDLYAHFITQHLNEWLIPNLLYEEGITRRYDVEDLDKETRLA